MIELSNIKKSFVQGNKVIQVLDGADLNVQAGQKVAILGKSGSGKSTMLSLLSGLDKPDSGSIKLSGVQIESMQEKELTEFRAKNLSIIFQQYHLIDHLSALENVQLALDILGRENSKEIAKDYLKKVGLEHRENHLPSQLSGGERQRVAIARAICVKPNILLADEPSGNLDETTAKEVMSLLFELIEQDNLAFVLVTHDKELAKSCDSVFVLENHKLNLND